MQTFIGKKKHEKVVQNNFVDFNHTINIFWPIGRLKKKTNFVSTTLDETCKNILYKVKMKV